MYNNEMQALMANGGLKDEGGTKDPVSGNDVPAGSLQSEVRDDIDAKLSEGEFVFSADVVRYIGLNNLMKLRDEAKAGLAKMESIGQMGNSSEVPDAEAPHGDDFESTLDEVMAEVEKEHAHATGGMVGHYATGGAVSYVDPANAAKYARAPLKGFEMVRFERADGTSIYIPYINGKPQLDIPEGYTMKTGVAPSAPSDTSTTVGTNVEGGVKTGGGGGKTSSTEGTDSGKTTATDTSSSSVSGKSLLGNLGFANISVNPDTGVATADKASVMNGMFGAIVGTVLGVGPVIGYKAEQTLENKTAEENAKDYNMKFSDTAPINGMFGPLSNTATEGVTGTGGQAAVAGAAAASAAQNAGYSDAACAAAGQAAANAALAGATQAAAIAAGMDAAKQQDAADKNASAAVASSSGPTAGAGSYGYGDSGSASAAASGTVGGYGPGTSGFGGDSRGGGFGGDGGPGSPGRGGGIGGGGMGGEGAGGGGYAKGGLVSKPHNKSKKKKSGIASR